MLAHIAAGVRHRAHEARADLLLSLLHPAHGATLLDLGGGTGSFAARIAERRPDLHITIAEIHEHPEHARLGFRAVRLDPDAALPFADAEYDVVLCNSVIEHVTLPHDVCRSVPLAESTWRRAAFQRQTTFAAEIRRVARSYFVQTPHPAFPIDVHTWLPFTSRLTHEQTRRLVRITDRVWIKKCGVADWHLLTPARMSVLFPDATITIERMARVSKSIIAWRPA